MIERIEDRNKLLTVLKQAPFFAAEMRAAWDAQGQEQFFLIEEKAVLLLRGGFAMLYGEVTDRPELEMFLRFQNVLCLQSSDWVPGGFEAQEQWIMRYQTRTLLPIKPDGYVLEREPSMYQAAHVCITPDVTDTPPDFWAAQACARRNKCGGEMIALKHNEEYAAIAGIFAQTEDQAYLASVVTAKKHRGRGCASYLTVSLAQEQAAAGKQVFLVCASELRPFYKRLGFVEEQKIQQSRKTE